MKIYLKFEGLTKLNTQNLTQKLREKNYENINNFQFSNDMRSYTQ